MAIYLPRGPILEDPEIDQLNVSALQSILPCHVIQVNYRCSKLHQYPTPIHDVATGYDWIVSNLLPRRAITRVGRSEHVGRVAVCGELIGGQLAAMLALTECRIGEPGVVAAALNNPIVDWVAFQEEMQVWPPVKKQNLSGLSLSVSELQKHRSQLFRKSAHYYDSFASPALLFRTAGTEVPGESEKGPQDDEDDLDELARFEREDFFREQRALSAVQGLLEPTHLSDVSAPIIKKRKSSRRYPSKALGLQLPRFSITGGADSILSGQADELSQLLKQSFARVAPPRGWTSDDGNHDSPVSDDMIHRERYTGLGLWDNTSAGRDRMRSVASWLGSSLTR